MLTRTKLTVAAAIVLCISSAAFAGGSRNDADPSGGYAVGPMGQIFGGVNPALHPEIFGRSETTSTYRTSPRKKVNNRY